MGKTLVRAVGIEEIHRRIRGGVGKPSAALFPVPAMRLHRSLPFALAAVFVAGCIDDPTAVEEEGAPPLSEEEIAFLGLTPLLKGLEAQENVEDSTAVDVGAGRVTLASGLATIGLAPRTLDEGVSTVVACDEGGEVGVSARLSGFVDEEIGAADLVLTLVLTPDLCQESSEDSHFTLFGDPNITMVLEILTEGDGVVDLEGTLTGGFGALTGGRVAECALDLAFSGSESADGVTLDVQGEVCGRPVSRTVDDAQS